jgi:hypothetical protein
MELNEREVKPEELLNPWPVVIHLIRIDGQDISV